MYKERLISAIKKYKSGLYSEYDFKDVVESVAYMVTESHLFELREFLLGLENKLEFIDFSVNSNEMRDMYLEQILKLENYLDSML